jgi:hypothetical protein
MSSEHLTPLQIVRFVARTISGSELSIVVRHIAVCKYCDKRCRDQIRRQYPPPSSFTEDDLVFCVRDCHLEFESLMSLAEGTLNSEVQWLFGLHLKTCESCTEELKACKRSLADDQTFSADPSQDEDYSN